MQKIIVSILLVSYLAVSTGIIVNSHFCMNRLASKEVFGAANDTCGKCGMHKDKAEGCCHDEVTLYKISSDQKMSAAAVLNFELPAIFSQPVSDYLISPINGGEEVIGVDKDFPPPRVTNDLYLQYGVFRI